MIATERSKDKKRTCKVQTSYASPVITDLGSDHKIQFLAQIDLQNKYAATQPWAWVSEIRSTLKKNGSGIFKMRRLLLRSLDNMLF